MTVRLRAQAVKPGFRVQIADRPLPNKSSSGMPNNGICIVDPFIK